MKVLKSSGIRPGSRQNGDEISLRNWTWVPLYAQTGVTSRLNLVTFSDLILSPA
jgi:hypothetical protein